MVVGRKLPSSLLLCLALTALCVAARAEVVAADAAGFISEHELRLPVSPTRAYEALTREVHAWWDASHSYSGDAANFSLDARAGGCFCEALADGGSVMHMHVLHADPGRLLRLGGGLGPLQGMGVSGSMDFALEAVEGGSLLKYRYAVHGYAPGGLEGLAPVVDEVQRGQLERLKAYLERG